MAEQQTANVINDINTLLKIPTKILNELSTKMCLCIGSIISEAKLKGEKSIAINIGIGVLGIELSTMQCKFSPSKELKAILKKALVNGVDPLELALEKTLSDKLIQLCNEVL